ncbi:hypothetical protein GCM10023189_37780 [Nibrella saemangeumensis]|uniref:Inner membrane protein n=1 Tax=Nibrella saemangeumensis TaxID=1084526 RepID=A0ABP8N9N5_9BACT
MQSFNHVAGGFAFAGIFASFADVNIYAGFDSMAVVWVAAVLPDIDHTRSLIGKTAYPLASWLQRNYGHRTITHSVFFYVALVLVVKLVDNLFGLHYTLPVALALLSHLIFDMCTKQGVPVFYPFSKRPAVLPANPKLRLSANDFRSEAILFLLFCCLNLFSYPLMASGFWTRYNKSFATWDHLEREQHRKPGDYRATFLHETDTVTALIYSRSATELVVYRNRQFEKYPAESCKLIEFQATGRRHELRPVNLFQVTADSLNSYMRQAVVKITAQSARELYYYEGTIMKKGLELSSDYPNGAKFYQLALDNSLTEHQLKLLIAQHKEEQRKYGAKMLELATLRDALATETTRQPINDHDEGKRREKVKELSQKIDSFVKPDPVNDEEFRIQKAMLEIKLEENAHINAQLLIWQTIDNRN